MKRISTFLLAAAMLFGSVGTAHAVDVKVKGQFDFAYGWSARTNFTDKSPDRDRFLARQRVRTQINFIASEFLQGVLMFEIGTNDWGRGGSVGQGSGGGLDADGVNVETKRAYIDWIVPETNLAIRMGIQGLALPSATGFGNPVFSADVAAITASYQFTDMFGLTGFWARPFDRYRRDSGYSVTDANNRTYRRNKLSDETDMFGLIAPITGDGWIVTPWAVAASVGNQSGLLEYLLDPNFDNGTSDGDYLWGKAKKSFAWWAGTAIELDLIENWSFNFDVMYGSLGKIKGSSFNANKYRPADGGFDSIRMRGWLLDASINYKMDWATAGVFGWWSTGDKASKVRDGKFGRMPVVGIDDGFAPTSFGFAGTKALMDDSIVSHTGVGTWGIGIQLADMSFIENLSHTLRFAYYRGTNEYDIVRDGNITKIGQDGLYLTDKDSAFEINFDHKYQIYENLAAYLELGYINLDLKGGQRYSRFDDEDAWKAQILFQYKF